MKIYYLAVAAVLFVGCSDDKWNLSSTAYYEDPATIEVPLTPKEPEYNSGVEEKSTITRVSRADTVEPPAPPTISR